MDEIKVVMGRSGRINIPARHRRSLGLVEGVDLVIGVEDGALRIESSDEAIKRVQQMVRGRLGEGRTPSEELILERKAEVRAEEARD